MKNSYHTVNPIVRIKENELLSKEQFEQLIQANSFQKIAEILTPTVYGKYLTENYQYDFEQSLNQELVQTYEELIEIVPYPELVWLYTMRFTFHNLKIITKGEKIKENYDYLFIPDGFYTIEDLRSAIQTGESSVLPKTIIQCIKEVRQYFEESKILQGIDVIYDRYYYREQRRIAEQLNDAELLEEVIQSIDLLNITTTARCLLQKRTYAFMTTVVSSMGSFDKEELLSFAQQPLSVFIDYIRQSKYGELLGPALTDKTIDFAKVNILKDNYLTKVLQIAQTQAFGPLPLMAFLNGKDIEVMNLRLIIVGKRSGFTEEAIRERMRLLYDL